MSPTQSRTAAAGDGGFSLVEVIVAMALLMVVFVAVSTFLVQGTASATMLQRRQAAVALADQSMELIRSVPVAAESPTGSLLVGGRSQTLVEQQWLAAPAEVKAQYLATMKPVWSSAPTAAPVAVDYRTTATVSDQPYTVDQYLGLCYRAVAQDGACTAAPSGAARETRVYRAVVVVGWSPGAGQTCGGSACRFVLASLLDPLTDPVFMLNGGSIGGAAGAAADDAVSVVAQKSVTLNVKSNDVGTLGQTPVTVTSQPARGTVTPAGAGSGPVTYTSTSWQVGPDTFTYRLTDSSGGTTTGTVTVTVTAPARPTAVSGASVCLVGTAAKEVQVVTGTVAPWDLHAVAAEAGFPPGVTVTRSATTGGATLQANGTVVPQTTTSVVVTDPSGQSVTVPLTVRAVAQGSTC